jgi:hypothetical protein
MHSREYVKGRIRRTDRIKYQPRLHNLAFYFHRLAIGINKLMFNAPALLVYCVYAFLILLTMTNDLFKKLKFEKYVKGKNEEIFLSVDQTVLLEYLINVKIYLVIRNKVIETHSSVSSRGAKTPEVH